MSVLDMKDTKHELPDRITPKDGMDHDSFKEVINHPVNRDAIHVKNVSNLSEKAAIVSLDESINKSDNQQKNEQKEENQDKKQKDSHKGENCTVVENKANPSVFRTITVCTEVAPDLPLYPPSCSSNCGAKVQLYDGNCQSGKCYL